MTPREPDRFDKRVGELARHVEELIFDGDEECGSRLRWSLRRMAEEVEAETLERAAQVADESHEDGLCIAFAIRTLRLAPAAAPAAETKVCVCRYLDGAEFMGKCPAHPAPPSEPAAPAPDLRCEACGDRLADEDAMHAHDRTWHGAAEAELLDRISELEAALRELARAATEHANAHGCSGDLGARLSDAKALLAVGTSQGGAGEGT